MLSPLFICFLLFWTSASALKFICYSPRFGSSHVNYLGKLSDSLIDAGHEVVILSPILNSRIRGAGSDKARIPQNAIGREFEERMSDDVIDEFWKTSESWRAIQAWGTTFNLFVAQCNDTINYPGLFDTLRAEKFDAGFGESIDWCTAAHLGGSFSDEMTFLQRAENLFNFIVFEHHIFEPTEQYQRMFEENVPGFPNIVDLMAANSLYFLNSDPLVDFPRPSAARMIDLGGIAVSNGQGKLDEEWSAIFDLRPKTLLMSFGTVAQAWAMPEEYKETIRATARAMPDVTFIWKYEKPEHNVTQAIPNLIEATWLPQREMLNDPRLSAFMTHCGQGSTTEANYAGVPLIVVPIFLDQIRNAFQVKRNGVGLNLDKTDLGNQKVFASAIREVLENPKYVKQAKQTASMLRDKPFTAREIFVRNMEFLAKYGPLRQLDHYGRNLNIFQYYLIDFIAFVALSVSIILAVSTYVIVKAFTPIGKCLFLKNKVE